MRGAAPCRGGRACSAGPARPRCRQPPVAARSAPHTGGDAPAPGCGRRQLLLQTAGVAAAAAARPAHAKKLVQRADGSEAEAHEFDVGLRVVALAGSVPADWEQEFRQALRGRARFQLQRRAQLQDVFSELSQPDKKKSAATADVVSLGDAFLAPAIARGLLQPLQRPEQQDWWKLVSPRWQQLLRRYASGRQADDGWVWGAPFRWGCTLIAYRTDKLSPRRGGRPIEDWADLLQPALANRVGVTEGPREFLGAVFKSLGLPLNAREADLVACGVSEEQLADRVVELRRQVRQVSGREQQQALAAGNIWAAVGPSSALVPLALQHNNIALIAPASGTALWADLWVVPRHAQGGHLQQGPSPLLPAWLAYGLEPARVSRKKGLQAGASPLLLPGALDPRACAAGARGRGSRLAGAGSLDLSLGALMPGEDVLARSEFLQPLDERTRELFWRVMRPSAG